MDAQVLPSSLTGLATSGFDVTFAKTYPLEPVPLTLLIRQIHQAFEQYGFSQFCYYGLMDSPHDRPEDKGLSSYQQFRQAPHVVSSEDPDKVHSYLREVGEEDRPFWSQLAHVQHPVQRPEPEQQVGPSQKVWDFLTSNHIHSQLFIPMYSFCNYGWYTRFMLNSQQTPAELSRWMQAHQPELLQTCFYFHSLLMRDYSYLFNPWLGNKMISDRALDVLTLTANGLGSKEIAGKINLSEKGVNYHLNHLRELLGAENRVHLVAVAKDMKII